MLPGRRAERRLFWSALPPLQAGLLGAATLAEEAPLPGGLLLAAGGWVWGVLHANRLRDAGRWPLPGCLTGPVALAAAVALAAWLGALLGAPPQRGLPGLWWQVMGGAAAGWLAALLAGPCLLASLLCGVAGRGRGR
ncbi:MAG: hypothetical protein N2588_03720 [Rhodovarius sp.]|nr:hypothetical protein [Rhodovarius sp.]